MTDSAELLRTIRTRNGSTAFHDLLIREMAERAGVSMSQVRRVAAELLAANFDEKLFTDGNQPQDERVAALLQKSRKAMGNPFDETGRGVLSGYGATQSRRLADDADLEIHFLSSIPSV